MNEKQRKRNWDEIPHLRIGEIPGEMVTKGPLNALSLIVAKRSLLEVHEQAAEDPVQAMEDATANIMMLCCYLGVDFESILDSARHSHREETDFLEMVLSPVFEARSMPGHYHLEFEDDEEFEGDPEDDEGEYVNGSLEECILKMQQTQRVLKKAAFICQFGCGQEHALHDNERILLGLEPLSLEANLVWGGGGKEMVKRLFQSIEESSKPK